MGSHSALTLDVAEEVRTVTTEVFVLETVAFGRFYFVEPVYIELANKTTEIAMFEVSRKN